MKTTRSRKQPRDKAILVNLAESIGSTLGSIAAKADAAQKALTKRTLTASIKRKTKAVTYKAKKAARGLTKTKRSGARRRLSANRVARRRSAESSRQSPK